MPTGTSAKSLSTSSFQKLQFFYFSHLCFYLFCCLCMRHGKETQPGSCWETSAERSSSECCFLWGQQAVDLHWRAKDSSLSVWFCLIVWLLPRSVSFTFLFLISSSRFSPSYPSLPAPPALLCFRFCVPLSRKNQDVFTQANRQSKCFLQFNFIFSVVTMLCLRSG